MCYRAKFLNFSMAFSSWFCIVSVDIWCFCIGLLKKEPNPHVSILRNAKDGVECLIFHIRRGHLLTPLTQQPFFPFSMMSHTLKKLLFKWSWMILYKQIKFWQHWTNSGKLWQFTPQDLVSALQFTLQDLNRARNNL